MNKTFTVTFITSDKFFDINTLVAALHSQGRGANAYWPADALGATVLDVSPPTLDESVLDGPFPEDEKSRPLSVDDDAYASVATMDTSDRFAKVMPGTVLEVVTNFPQLWANGKLEAVSWVEEAGLKVGDLVIVDSVTEAGDVGVIVGESEWFFPLASFRIVKA